jgi:membrane protein
MSKLSNFLKELYRIWITERPSQQAAALAYYSMFAFAPVIYVAVTIAGFFIKGLGVTDLQFARLEQILGQETTQLIYDMVSNLSKTTSSGSILLSLIGFLALLFAASGLFYQLQFALNKIWNVPPPKKGETTSLIRQRVFAFVMVIGLGILLALLSAANVLFSMLTNLFPAQANFKLPGNLLYVLLVAGIFILLYRLMPQKKIGWRDVWLGAVTAALLITIGGYLLGLYIRSGRTNSAIEAAGAFAVLLIGFYFFAQVFLLGAVICRVYAGLFGTQRRAQVDQEE